MKLIIPISVVICLCWDHVGAAESKAGCLPFQDEVMPLDGVDAWNWVSGSGKLSLNEQQQLVLQTDSPPKDRDNRVGANIDLGNQICESFVLDISIDPASNISGDGCNALDCGITVGLPSSQVNPNRFQASHDGLSLNIRDLSDRADYGVFWRNRDLSLPVPVSGSTGNPRALNRHDGFYHFRMIVTPTEQGSYLRVYHSQFVSPDWEGEVPKRLMAGHVGIYARLAGHSGKTIETTIASLSLRPIDPKIAERKTTDAECVLYSLNLDYPGLENVKLAMEAGDIPTASAIFADYLRERKNVIGPTVATTTLDQKEQKIADLMVEDKVLVYTGGPLFEHQFGNPYDWSVDPYKTGGQFAIYNARMYPWLYMGRAYQASKDPKYSRAFVKQLNSWLDQIPLRIVATPGNGPFFIDGNTLEPPLLFTGNMGRRIELTWWQTYELFKESPEFDNASMMRMMRYFQENARLVTNPSIFLAWDDSGLHMATGLLQCATMMPEWNEAAEWKEIAFDRLDQTFRAQVHSDGTHASLSTGYGWATIDSYRNVFEIMGRNNLEFPPKFRQSIRGMIMGYMGILRPDFGNISLNDGGWGAIDEKVRESLPLFPNDPEMAYFASRGAEGKAPSWTSRYFPNAGWYAMRTGFGPNHKMLFMDGGPFGASHGKQDALHLVVACGNDLLLRDGGRGDYTSTPTSVWASETLAFNTLTPDWALQDRTHRYEHEKHVGLNPPTRPWISNTNFDYGRSSYDAGWFRNGQRIGGKHTRHIVFLKGNKPPETGYWIVVDQVEPDDDTLRTWRHPWHLSTEDFSVDELSHSLTTQGGGAKIRILPIDPDQNMKLQIIEGQTEPALQGWKVWGSEAKPFAVPTYRWETKGPFTKAWLLLPKNVEQKNFEIVSVSAVTSDDNKLSFQLNRTDGGHDHIVVATDGQQRTLGPISGKTVQGSLGIVRVSQEGHVQSVLEAD